MIPYEPPRVETRMEITSPLITGGPGTKVLSATWQEENATESDASPEPRQ